MDALFDVQVQDQTEIRNGANTLKNLAGRARRAIGNKVGRGDCRVEDQLLTNAKNAVVGGEVAVGEIGGAIVEVNAPLENNRSGGRIPNIF